MTRLWFSDVPFCFSKHERKERAANTITSPATTINEIEGLRLVCDKAEGFHGESMLFENLRVSLMLSASPKFLQVQRQQGGHSGYSPLVPWFTRTVGCGRALRLIPTIFRVSPY